MLLIVVVLGFLIGREVLLALGVTRLRESLTAARALRLAPGLVASQCEISALSDIAQATVEQVQLTFTSDTEFQLEIVCRAALRDPVVVSTFKLPPLVKKVPGTSGLIWDKGTTGVTLEVWGRRRSLILEANAPMVINGYLPAGIGTGPMASCSGYGYTCCPTDSSVGNGLQTSLVNDCPRTCFSQCLSRPVILSFNSQPFYDLETRIISVTSGESVTFNYVTDPGAGQTGQVKLDFGDGTQDVSSEATGSLTHTYTCAEASCEYSVQLTVRDDRGTESAATPVSRLIVNVSGS